MTPFNLYTTNLIVRTRMGDTISAWHQIAHLLHANVVYSFTKRVCPKQIVALTCAGKSHSVGHKTVFPAAF